METWLKKVKNNWRPLTLAFLSFLFFLSAASFIYLTRSEGPVKFDSPDETANYIFAKLYSQTSELTIFEKYNLYADDLIKPRSFRSDEGEMKPVSFLGIILLYGWLARFSAYQIIPYLTPFFAALGVLFFYGFLKNIFGRRNAFLSACLLFACPPYFYYSVRGLFHNVLFIVLFLAFLYFSALGIKKKKTEEAAEEIKAKIDWKFLAFFSLAGLLFGLAASVRASELLWLIPLALFCFIINRRKIGLTGAIFFLAGAFLAILPGLYWNQILYGSPLASGYTEINRSIAETAQAGGGLIKAAASGQGQIFFDLTRKIKENIFYFGFKPKQSLALFYFYFIRLFPWLFWPAFLGFIISGQRFKKWRKKHFFYLVAYGFVSLFLIIYYGSWKFNDNPDPREFSLGNSYTRYWLPVYLGCLPWAAIFLVKFSKIFHKPSFTSFFRFLLLVLAFAVSFYLIFFGSSEGLYYSPEKKKNNYFELQKVTAATPPQAVIITRYHDKIFFPERKVIVGMFTDKNLVKVYADLVRLLPVYYYNFTLPTADLKWLNERRLKEFNLRIEKTEEITKDFTLYRLESAEK